MRAIQVQVSQGELVIFDWIETDPNHPDFFDDTPIHLPIEEALETVNLEGYGTNLSKFIVDLLFVSRNFKIFLKSSSNL